MLTDKEFRHYQELYNNDPIVQRLCKMDYIDDLELDLESKVADLEDQVSDLDYQNMCLQDERDDLLDKVEELEKKILVWETLEKNDDNAL
jgi:chromosome condensin MukBEF ATPase and DNA-binding subunit MukB